MRQETVTFYSDGERVAGTIRLPDGDGPHPAVVQGPGWLGLRDARLYVPYHEALTAAGFAVLIFDYRGFGDSGGDPTRLSPRRQLEDLENAVTYIQSRDDIAAERIGVFGSGGTGGGNAVLLAGSDHRIGCAVAQVPVADGADWLRRMRSEPEWEAFLARVDEDRAKRVTTGRGALVHPREEIMVPSPERRRTTVKADVDARVPTRVSLAAADELLRYRPIDAAAEARNLMVIAVEDDPVTPTDHAVALYEAAPAPKRLILQRHTTHYAAYEQYGPVVIPQIVDWFTTHLVAGEAAASEPEGVTIVGEEP